MSESENDEQSADYQEAYKKFSEWIEFHEGKLNAPCDCCPPTSNLTVSNEPNQNTTSTTSSVTKPLKESNGLSHKSSNQLGGDEIATLNGYGKNGLTAGANGGNGKVTIDAISTSNQCLNSVIKHHQEFRDEIVEYGQKLNFELKRHLNEDPSLINERTQQSSKLEDRWHTLFLNAFEQLVVVELTKRCPKNSSTDKHIRSVANKKQKLQNTIMNRVSSSMSKQRIRPMSYPNNNVDIEWDYRHTMSLTGGHKENGSHIDLDSVDEQVTKNLTEFGENYELYFGKEDDITSFPVHSRAPSVEPDEKPKLAKATITSDSKQDDVNYNLLMLTTSSSMFSVDATKCLHKRTPSFFKRLLVSLLLAIFLIIFSALYHEPHHMHKSYYNSQPPV